MKKKPIKKKKQTKKKIAAAPSVPPVEPFRHKRELFALSYLTLNCILFLSLVSFAYGGESHNWIGAIGYTLGWIFHTTFGIGSYLICLFGAWLSWRRLFGKSINHIRLRSITFLTFLTSFCLFLSLIDAEFPRFGWWLEELFYPRDAKYPIPYYIGGLPFYYLYSGLPSFSLSHIFNALGTFILCMVAMATSIYFFFRLSMSDILAKIKSLFAREKSTFLDIQEEIPPFEEVPQAPKKKRRLSPKEPVIITSEVHHDEHLPPPRPRPKKAPPTKKEAAIQAQAVYNGDFKNYKVPSPDMLTPPKKVDQTSLKQSLKTQAEVLEETLASFGIEAKVGQINCGPTITSFEVHPAVGVKVQRIKALSNDIALNMQATSIRIIAPIPGKAAVGVEIPNPEPQEVSFREMLTAYRRANKRCHIPLLLGKTVNGEHIISDLAKMPHCIIAGATGSGKSVCINTIVMSILYNAKPDEIRLLLIDPKKVELTPYSNLPHMIAPVITEPGEAYTAMQWLVGEMEKRYELLNKLHFRNIESFNNRTPNKEKEEELNIDVPERLPYMVGIIDELADLMMCSNNDIETPIARIAQMARAVGIHLILATQRPSREVITGLIKANFPTRICFNVSSGINSKIVLDAVGAEQLLGNGDMLFLPPGTAHLSRVQGAYIRDEDIHSVIEFCREQAPASYLIPTFAGGAASLGLPGENGSGRSDLDPLYEQALEVVYKTGNASTTFLQRKLKVGYAFRAGGKRTETFHLMAP